MKLDKIELKSVLPNVFSGEDSEGLLAQSQVWMKDICFVKGQHYLIEAESGAGKSSLCSFIYGYRSDYSGSILFNGTNIRKNSISQWCDIRRHSIALLPQEMRLFPELTAIENIQIKNSLTKHCSQEQILEMLQRLEIGHKAHSLVSKLSIGQQQRVAIVRTLCQPFSFVILDEPVSHLDQRNNRIVADLIAEKAKEQNAAIISTSVGNQLLINGPVNHIHL